MPKGFVVAGLEPPKENAGVVEEEAAGEAAPKVKPLDAAFSVSLAAVAGAPNEKDGVAGLAVSSLVLLPNENGCEGAPTLNGEADRDLASF